jgi:hypothetical protein
MTTCTIAASRVISEIVDGEAIIIDSLTGAYFTLDPLGTELWSLLSTGPQTTESLLSAAGEQVGRAASALIELHEAGLVDADGPLPAASRGGTPVLTKYSDMEELLLLDPIHDVDEAGWPVLPSDA